MPGLLYYVQEQSWAGQFADLNVGNAASSVGAASERGSNVPLIDLSMIPLVGFDHLPEPIEPTVHGP
jgi:hypothetical protein